MKTLKNLIPMSDEEQDQAELMENNIIIPSIYESTFLLESPSKSYIGDFTSNPFMYNGEEVINREQIPQKDDSNVYMKSIIDLFQSMNCKIENLMKQKSKEETVIEDCYKKLLFDDSKGAMVLLRKYANIKVSSEDIINSFIQKDWPEFVFFIKEDCMNLKEAAFKIQSLFEGFINKFMKKLEECERLKNIINKQNCDHVKQIEMLVAENNEGKDGLIGLLNEFGSGSSLFSGLESDAINSLRQLLSDQKMHILELIKKHEKAVFEVEEFNKKAEDYEVSSLSKQVCDYKLKQKQLQAENINFSEIVHKLSEKNIKLKQDLVMFNGELKKAMGAIESKNETIRRQKALIEMFQDKLSGSHGFPIEELKQKRIEIESKIDKETDFIKKQNLKKEKFDCEKRLSDFINLNNKR